MTNDNWTQAEMAAGYEAMAELNLALAGEFAALEDEAAQLLEQLWVEEK